jgi:hypothetical protein
MILYGKRALIGVVIIVNKRQKNKTLNIYKLGRQIYNLDRINGVYSINNYEFYFI